jgi:AcrR family transcriptional regulator
VGDAQYGPSALKLCGSNEATASTTGTRSCGRGISIARKEVASWEVGPDDEQERSAGVARRVGRPRRLTHSGSDLEPRDEILAVAAELFSSRGYTSTSTRAIALGVGLQQGSIFHHFARKEDILAELLDRTVRPALAFSSWLDRQAVSPEVGLHALTFWDVRNLCSGPYNVAGLQLSHEARGPRFSSFWLSRGELRARYAVFIDAIAESPSRSSTTRLATELVFGLIESVLIWFDRGGATSVDEVAFSIAEGVLVILGIGRSEVSVIADKSAAVCEKYPTT